MIRTRVGQSERFPARPLLHLQERQLAGERNETGLVYARVDDSQLARLAPQGVLGVLALKVVYAVHALLVQHDKSFIVCPSEAHDLALVPLWKRETRVATHEGKIATLNSSNGSPAGEYT